MVAQVVVGVANEDPKDQAAPQLAQVLCGWRVLLDGLGDVQVAGLVTVGGFEHRHRARVSNTAPARTVEPVDDQHGLAVHIVQSRACCVDASAGG